MNNSAIDIIKDVHLLAFEKEEGKAVAELVIAFFLHPETISINATRDEKIVGNVLFTPFIFKDHPNKKCYLLAPLGVLPDYQLQGVGRELVQTGIESLKAIGADAIFVLGVPTYYPQYGFVLAEQQTPYPDLLTKPEAWMVLELNAGVKNQLSGETRAIEPFMKAGFWDTSGR